MFVEKVIWLLLHRRQIDRKLGYLVWDAINELTRNGYFFCVSDYHSLDYYNNRDLHDISDETPSEEEINNYIYEQNYGIDKDYDDKDIDI